MHFMECYLWFKNDAENPLNFCLYISWHNRAWTGWNGQIKPVIEGIFKFYLYMCYLLLFLKVKEESMLFFFSELDLAGVTIPSTCTNNVSNTEFHNTYFCVKECYSQNLTYIRKKKKPESSLCVTVVAHLANQIARREDYSSVGNLRKRKVDYIEEIQIAL